MLEPQARTLRASNQRALLERRLLVAVRRAERSRPPPGDRSSEPPSHPGAAWTTP